ncbi:L-cysteine desulfidase family protein [Limosilactobacillus sp.]|uniref:L-cysteine desulfidase family protein n=1 Tax=Limosilactobacillus sp. TaxID=2773925 RepID=UPI003F031080
MDQHSKEMFLTVLKESIKPAKGCTEPVSVALAAATCGEQLNREAVTKIDVAVSANVFKNALAVIIPGTGAAGLPIAAAIGYLAGDPDAGLGVIPQITDDQREQVLALAHSGKVHVWVADVPDKLFVEVTVTTTTGHTANVQIAGSHTNIYRVQHDDQVVFDHGKPQPGAASEWEKFLQQSSLAAVWEFAMQEPLSELQFILTTRDYNMALSRDGLEHHYGMAVGRAMNNSRGLNTADSLTKQIITQTSAAADARMGGSQLLAATNSGSGNQGITATVPICVAAKYWHSSEEQLVRALTLSHLTTVYIHAFLPSLTAYCAVHASAMGAATGLCYLAGGTVEDAGRAIKIMIGDANGMVCDGAGCSCALKVSTAVQTMLKAVDLALQKITVPATNGVVSESVDKTIRDLGRLTSEGMSDTDSVILKIMRAKA